MYSAFINALVEWNRNSSDREKTQHIYLTITIISVLVAGLVSLIDAKTGQDILLVTAIGAFIFSVNAIVWALAESLIFGRLSGRRKRR